MRTKRTSYTIDTAKLPEKYPTHAHDSLFWETLGRTVGTFSFLEFILSKAIFAFTATSPFDAGNYTKDELDQLFDQWYKNMERAISDPLGGLIDSYKSAVTKHPNSPISDLDKLIEDLRKYSKIRNVLCHGAWCNPPDSDGKSTPYFFDRKIERFQTPIDVKFLNQVQTQTKRLICTVYNSVTIMGWQFPGSGGVGEVIVKNPSRSD